jgi:hypothetical protein
MGFDIIGLYRPALDANSLRPVRVSSQQALLLLDGLTVK